MLPAMRLDHVMYASLVAALFLGLASGCSDDSGGSEDNTASNGSTSGGTTNTATTNPTTSNTTASNTAASNTTAVTSTASSTTGGASNVPPDGSAASITAFLEAEGYKEEGWVSVHDAPVPETPGSPHGEVRVYLSPALAAFKQTNPDPLEEPNVPGAMAVKELYEASAVVGKAVIFYPASDVTYFCYGPAGRCATGHDATTIDAPEWGDGSASAVNQCDTCHAGLVFTELP